MRKTTLKEALKNAGRMPVETEDALTIVMEVPGVGWEAIDINMENDLLKIEAKIDPAKYEGMEPLYTEYNVGHFARSFTLSNKIDQQHTLLHGWPVWVH